MMASRWDLGNNRCIEVRKWNELLIIDFRQWIQSESKHPTTLGRFKNVLVGLQFIEKALKENYQYHRGGNVYCSVRDNNPYVDIRQYWKPEKVVVPTIKGLCLIPLEYERFKLNITLNKNFQN